MKEEEERQKKTMVAMCTSLDKDGDGTLSLKELLGAYDTVEEFRHSMQILDIRKKELGDVYKMLDTDGSGDVSYIEFCEQLHHMRTSDTRTMLGFIKFSIVEVRDRVNELKDTCSRLSDKVLNEHSEIVRQHTELLGNIDCRLNQLSGPGSEEVDNLLGQKLASTDTAVLPLSVDRVKKRIAGLSQQARELADVQRSILRRAEHQALTMGHHANILHSMHRLLGDREERALRPKDDQLLVQVDEALVQLQDNARPNLASLTRNLENKFQEGQTVLERNARILANLQVQLDCPEPLGGSLPSGEPKAQTHAISRGGPNNDRFQRQDDWSHSQVLPFCGCTSVSKQATMRRPSKWAETAQMSSQQSKGVNAHQH
mmetsp:Transcript_134937/g.262781  ORF Transcript_134937/g.262781 Transcript_134937/m.262781 type:complete len:372 (-) Transcript_134937:53-1168(-)